MGFSELIGNSKTKEILINSVKNNNILHSYLFYGTEGIGKKLFASEFAKMILCESNEKPCNKCKSCIEFNTNNHPDFFLIEPEKDSLKIDQIRSIQKNILEKPINGGKKIYIINDAETMTKEAQNCLLKTLEEPQQYVVIILICSNENKILTTVKSRCTKILFNNLTKQEILSYIMEKNSGVNFDENMLELCGGSLNKAINIMDKEEILNNVVDIANSIEKADELNFLANNEFFNNHKDDIKILLELLYVLVARKVNKNNINQCSKAMMHIINAQKKLSYSNNYDMTIDGMLINIWEEFHEKDYRS